MVAGDVRRLLGSSSGDLTLRTTLTLELQRLAEGVIARRLEVEGAKKNVSQASLVALSKDGAVLAMVGGRDYEASQFNRATQAKRQAGSLFKLFVYLTALQRGYAPQSVVVDRPTQIGEWEPQNYSGGFRGTMTLRNAFVHSINTIAAQLGDEVGIPPSSTLQSAWACNRRCRRCRAGTRLGRGYFVGDDQSFRRCRNGFTDRTLFGSLDCRQFSNGALYKTCGAARSRAN